MSKDTSIDDKANINIWGVERTSTMDFNVFQARAINFLYNKKVAKATPTLLEVIKDAGAIGYNVIKEENSSPESEGVIVEIYISDSVTIDSNPDERQLICHIKSIRVPSFFLDVLKKCGV